MGKNKIYQKINFLNCAGNYDDLLNENVNSITLFGY